MINCSKCGKEIDIKNPSFQDYICSKCLNDGLKDAGKFSAVRDSEKIIENSCSNVIPDNKKSVNNIRREENKNMENKFELKIAEEKEIFSTGAQRGSNAGKGRYDLLPALAIHRLALIFEKGGKIYGDDNYRKGINLRRYLDSGIRHAFKFLAGHRDEDHCAQAAWNFLCLLETQCMIENGLLPKELDNLPNYIKKDD